MTNFRTHLDCHERNMNGIVAIDKRTNFSYISLDFADLEISSERKDSVIINLSMKHKLHHTLPAINRCCKSSYAKISFDGIDDLGMFINS